MVQADDGASPAQIDRAVLEQMRSRFVGRRLFESAEIVTESRLHLHVELSEEYYPSDASARFEIRWYLNDDLNVHYQEDRQDGVWKCRWDRHPNSHNSREHFHPPPDASRLNAEDSQWPVDHRDVCRLVLDRLEERIEALWEHR